MFTVRKLLVTLGTGSLILLGGIGFWLYQRSGESKIQYQNAKEFVAAEPRKVSDTNLSPTTEITQEEAPVAKASEEEKAVRTEEKSEQKETAPKDFAIKSRLVSFGHESASNRTINTIVLHSSHGVGGDPYYVEDVISLWKSYGVAPHYMIGRDGAVYQLVVDKNIAYHAGDSKMPDGRKNVNDFSIGVEILNTKTDKYTSAQYQATKDLITYLKKKYGKMEVVGHDGIAPGRKTDPWNFDWDKL